MKKTILFLGVFLTFSLWISAQSLSLSHNSDPMADGDTLTVSGGVSTTLMAHVDVTNNSAAELSIKCRRMEVSLVSGSTNSFCWGGQCWPENVSQSTDPTVIAAGATATEFSGDYKANGNEGISIIIYKFFDMNNPHDTVTFVCKFVSSSVGISESDNNLSISPAFPNPSNKYTFISYQLSEKDNNAKVILSDMVGNEVKSLIVAGKEGKVRMDTYDMPDGIYFYSFILNNTVYYTKKLVVAHQ